MKPLTLFVPVLLCLTLAGKPIQAQIGSELFEWTPADAGAGDWFGASVAIDDNLAIVGAPLWDEPLVWNAGAAYVLDVTTGEQIYRLGAPNPTSSDVFGISVDISGANAIVGAHRGVNPDPFAGSAYVFDLSTGGNLMKLVASDVGPEDRFFGYSVGISDDVAVVGTRPDTGFGSGAAYFFDVDTGEELFKVVSANAEDGFAHSVAISGNTAIVAAWGDIALAGSAYLYDVITGQQRFRITASDGHADAMFGWSVAIDGNIAIIGAPHDNDRGRDAGAAYLFDVTSGEELFKLVAQDVSEGDLLGVSVAIDGNLAIVGAWGAGEVGERSGAAYLFDVRTGNELAKLTASDASGNDLFSSSVGLGGDKAIVGARRKNGAAGRESGAVYVFSTVPEPSSLVLIGICVACVLCHSTTCSVHWPKTQCVWRAFCLVSSSGD